MFKCEKCGNLTDEPKEQVEVVEVGNGYGNYPVGIVCPICGGDLEEVSTSNYIIEVDMEEGEENE